MAGEALRPGNNPEGFSDFCKRPGTNLDEILKRPGALLQTEFLSQHRARYR